MSSPKYCDVCSEAFDPMGINARLILSVNRTESLSLGLCPTCRVLVQALFQEPEGEESMQDALQAATEIVTRIHGQPRKQEDS